MIDINKERIAATFLSDLSRPQRESVLAILDELEDSRECVQNLLAENDRLRDNEYRLRKSLERLVVGLGAAEALLDDLESDEKGGE
jgi:regulator of replication initiation timing